MPIRNRFAEMQSEIAEWRRDIHAHPEVLFETHRTSALVADKLREFGCDEIVTGIGRTGVVGIINGKSNTSGRTIGLRADMDALPMTERTGLPYASTIPGAMHACGHDGHTAMLLGAAKYLSETRNFDGRVAVIFQPAEEGGGGGLEMCEDGILDTYNISEVYGMHNWPGRPLGTFAIRPGRFFAGTATFTIVIRGRGGHGAKPHDTIDPTVVASHVVLGLQTVVSRNNDPIEEMVVSVTSFETSSTAFNVIPQSVLLKGTVRVMSEEAEALAAQRVPEIAEKMADAFGASADVTYTKGYPVMVNSEQETEYAAEAAKRVAGDCADADLTMGAEDFAYFLQRRPGAYILVGNGDSANVHNEEYNFNDEAIPAGCSWWAEIAESRLPAA